MFPNFLLIGAQKAGTTALINYMANHPDIFVPKDKEASCFYDDPDCSNRFKKFSYKKYFDTWKGEKLAGNAPVNLLYFAEESAKRIYRFNDAMKLIAILRNPVERAYSAYWYFVRNGLEKESFETALEREKYIVKHGNFDELANFTYISHGYYYEQLAHFFRLFNEEQFLILIYDDFKNNPRETLEKIYAFLAINTYIPEDMLRKKYNTASKAKIPGLQKFIYQDHFLKRCYKIIFPESFRYEVHYKIVSKILAKNLTQFRYPQMKGATREILLKKYEQPNINLQNFLKLNLAHWNI